VLIGRSNGYVEEGTMEVQKKEGAIGRWKEEREMIRRTQMLKKERYCWKMVHPYASKVQPTVFRD
jgi:hypothetical protein